MYIHGFCATLKYVQKIFAPQSENLIHFILMRRKTIFWSDCRKCCRVCSALLTYEQVDCICKKICMKFIVLHMMGKDGTLSQITRDFSRYTVEM